MTPEQKVGLANTLGSAVALVDWLIAKHQLDRKIVADAAARAKEKLPFEEDTK